MDKPAYTFHATAPERATNGKYRACINIYCRRGRDTYPSSSVESGALFATAAEATAAARRAIECVEKTGAFPNMCEAF